MSSGGGGQSGVTRYDWNDVIGSYWGGRPGADGQGGGGWLGEAAKEAARGYRDYGTETGQARIASQNPDIWTAQQRVRDMANNGGPQETAIGRQAAGAIAGGAGITANPYMGDNPYFRDSLRASMEDVTNAYKQGTSADTTRLFNMSGAFGGSAHQNAVANNEAGLGRNLSRMANEAAQQQYDRSANLYEAGLGRQMQAIPLAFQGQGLQNDLNDRLQGVGDYQRNYSQSFLDRNYQDWAEKNNWNRNQINWMASLLGGAQGSTGVTTQFGGYAPTNYGSQAVGLGLLGRSAGLF